MNTPVDKGVFIPAGLITSPAFNSLRPFSSTVLMHFLRKRRFDKDKTKRGKDKYLFANNGEIVFTYTEATEWGFSKAKFTRIIDDLVEHGFVDIATPGTGMCGSVTLYSISERWRQFGTTAFVTAKRQKRYSHAFKPGHANPRYNPLPSVKNDACQASKMTLRPNPQASRMTLSKPARLYA